MTELGLHTLRPNEGSTKDTKRLGRGKGSGQGKTGGHGHKGYNLALIVDCLTQGLSGFGRKDHETAWTASVLVQVFDPALFAGIAAFTDQSGHIANLCRASQPRPGVSAVRIPGDNALEQKNEALLNGVSLSAPIVASLTKAARQYGVVVPVSIERVA